MNELKRVLSPIVKRQQSWRTWNMFLYWWGVLAIISGLILIRSQANLPVAGWVPYALTCLLLIGTFIITWINSSSSRFDYQQLARNIEEKHPELHATLLTAMEQKPDPQTGEYNFLQRRLLEEAKRAYESSQFNRMIPKGRLFGFKLLLSVLFVVTCVCLGKIYTLPNSPSNDAQTLTQKDEPKIVADAQLEKVEPGSIEVERGTPLAILAHFKNQGPSKAELVVTKADKTTRRLELTKNLDDPIFGATLPFIEEAFSYYVDYDGKKSETYQVRVFEHPYLDRADAFLKYPNYTKLPDRKVEATRRLSAVEGTLLSYQFNLNKPVSAALLTNDLEEPIPLKVHATQPLAQLPPLRLTRNQIWKLELTDSAGRKNKLTPRIEISVYPNKLPSIRIANPRGDQQISPLEEVDFAAELQDDFGLGSYGLTYNVNGGEMKDILLGKDASANTKITATHLLAVETLGVEPDQLINWFFWAEDTGPDGQTRRSYSDMYFSEIRPFEEIFRQGDPSQQQQQQQQEQQQKGQTSPNQQTEELIKLQKQIINATWKLRRNPDTLTKNIPVLIQGQKEALEKAKVLLDKSSDEKQSEFIKTIITNMEASLKKLNEAQGKPKQ